LHGLTGRYEKFFDAIECESPRAVFLGGDLLPHRDPAGTFLEDVVASRLAETRDRMGGDFPDVFVIMGNDDARSEEAAVLKIAERGLWTYLHNRRVELDKYAVYGYAYVPPTPFVRKDWDRYDVSRELRSGCVAPENGHRTVDVEGEDATSATIAGDLSALAGEEDLRRAVFLFHTPPFDTALDRVAVYDTGTESVGSIAVREFIEKRQPLVTLHGHIHESARLTGSWKETIGRTVAINGAHDGAELSLVRFDLDAPESADRVLL
jgi:Icc-related predicted phosphoesterase